MPQDIDAALADLAKTFATLRVRWYVFGAQAVAAAGVPRYTADIDVTVEVPRAGVRALVAALERNGFTLRAVGDAARFIDETRVIPVDHIRSKMPVDVVLAGPGLEEEIMERARVLDVAGTKVPFIGTADLIALKMLAGRHKDLEDVRSLIRARVRGLSIAEARQRTTELGALVDDSTLAGALDRIIEQEAKPSSRRTPIAKIVKKARGPRGTASRKPRRR